jgi:tRNA-specific 2-thiouridylase
MICVVGLSGGVDSSVSALLMREKGYDVIGCTLRMQNTEKANDAIEDASRVASFLNIPFEIVDCVEDFKQYVVDYFVNSYKNGITPNPCVMCNSMIKFKYLNKFRREKNADRMATGHYAKVIHGVEHNLHQAKDLTRDQSYFMYSIDREFFKYIEFPLGEYAKKETREIARKNGLHVAEKSDSQDVCFIPNGNHVSFVSNALQIDQNNGGNIIDSDGNILGKHSGVLNYTIGQRKGIGLSGGPFFVSEINVDKNEIVVTNKDGVKAEKIHLKNVKFINNAFSGECLVKVRSTGKKVKALLSQDSSNKDGREWCVEICDYEYGSANGQHCVFYDNDRVIGGGEIYKR